MELSACLAFSLVPLEHPPFGFEPMCKIVAVLMAAFAVEPVSQLLDFFLQLCLLRSLRRCLVVVWLLLVFVSHPIPFVKSRPRWLRAW